MEVSHGIIIGYEFLKLNKINIYQYIEKFGFENEFKWMFDEKLLIANNDNKLTKIALNIPDDELIQEPIRRYNLHFKDKIEKEIKHLVDKGYIRESDSKWNNPITPVKKNFYEIRLTIDFTKLNKIVKIDNYTLPRIDEILHAC